MRLAVVVLLTLLYAVVLAHNCITLSDASRTFTWEVNSGVLSGEVLFKSKSLNTGWVAVGVSGNTGSGMGDSDILMAWKSNGQYVYSMRHATGTGFPAKASGAVFDTYKVTESGGDLLLEFTKKQSYSSVSSSVTLRNETMSLLSASNSDDTNITEDSFSGHNWRYKVNLNYYSEQWDTLCNESPESTTSASSAANHIGILVFLAVALIHLIVA